MKMKRDAHLSTLVLAAGVSLAGGCIKPVSEATPKAAAMKECGPAGQVDDFEDNNNQNLVIDNRGGYWYTFVDKVGSTVWPEAGEAGGTFAPVEGGYNSKYAAEFKGKISISGTPLFSGLGMNFQDPKAVYDASKYEGITFFAKRGPTSTDQVRMKVPDGNTDPEGGVCGECFNDFGMDIKLSEQWTRYTFPFRDMKQMEGWGQPRKAHIDPSKLFGVQWQVNVPGADYDVFIDNLGFICKG